MLEHVELVSPAALALLIVDVERLVPEQARKGDPVPDREIEGVSRDGLPGKLAAHSETADVTACEELLAGPNGEPNASPDERISPVHRARLGDGAIAPKEHQIGDFHRRPNIERD